MPIFYNPLISLLWITQNRLDTLGAEITLSEQKILQAFLNYATNNLKFNEPIKTIEDFWNQHSYKVYLESRILESHTDKSLIKMAYVINNSNVEEQAFKIKLSSENSVLDQVIYTIVIKLLNLKNITGAAILLILNATEDALYKISAKCNPIVKQCLDENQITVCLINTLGTTTPIMETIKHVL